MTADLTGMKFGRWTVVGPAEDKVLKSGYHEKMWNCVCACGQMRVVRGKSLRSGISKSCGCLQREELSKRVSIHGGFGTRLYAVWNSMRQRCNNPNHRSYHNYGGRGITICDEWNDYSKFREWAIESGYKEEAVRGILTLDRIDVNGPYAPQNCRWSDMKEQARNRRESIIVNFDTETKPLIALSEEFGVKYCTAWKQYRQGIPLENIFHK